MSDEAKELPASLVNAMWNYWGLRVSGTEREITISNRENGGGVSDERITLMTDRPAPILGRFDEREAMAFLAGVWWGHRVAPLSYQGKKVLVVV